MDSTPVTQESLCSRCGAELPPGGAGGFCPTCLLRSAARSLPGFSPQPPRSHSAGSRIGAYVLKERLGEGGFGIVWRAEQLEPVQRGVALKILKQGVATAETAARFDGERQALAMMDHPNIAGVLDAGKDEDGVPFFVMELVRGEPVTAFCQTRRLGLDARVELFIQICRGVQHAHQKGVIHRDLKPSNVLVTEVDGRPVAKVIDFGVARALEQTLTDYTLYTRCGQIVGTPQYMSPEQADSGGADVDTRSDVYSLGVILYELLTGTPPLDETTLHGAGYAEVLRVIREVEPPRPSTRLRRQDTEGQRSPEESRDRPAPGPCSPFFHSSAFPTDLDWIVMKALEKDRERRFATPEALAADLLRMLQHMPVEARPPTLAYQLRRFMKRHRTEALAAVCILAALVAGTMVSMWQAVRATKAEGRALDLLGHVEQERNTAVLKSIEAEKARNETRAVNDFIVAALGSPLPGREGRDVTVADTLERAEARIETDLAGQPESQMQVLNVIARTCRGLGMNDRAHGVAHRMERLAAAAFSSDPVTAASWLIEAAWGLREIGQFTDAIPMLREALRLMEGRMAPDDEQWIEAHMALGHSCESSDLREAILWHRKALALCEAALPADHARRLTARLNVAKALAGLGPASEVVPTLHTIWTDALTTTHRTQLFWCAEFYANRQGNADPATVRDIWQRTRDRLAATGSALDDLAVNAALRLERTLPENEALAHLEKLTAALEAAGPAALHLLARAREARGARLFEAGRIAEAEAVLQQLMAANEAEFGPWHPLTVEAQLRLAKAWMKQNRETEALDMLQQSARKRREVRGLVPGDTVRLLHAIGIAYYEKQNYDAALPWYEERFAVSRDAYGMENLATLLAQRDLGEVNTRLGRYETAEKLLRAALAGMEKVMGPENSTLLLTHQYLANCLRHAGK